MPFSFTVRPITLTTPVVVVGIIVVVVSGPA